MSNVNLDQTIFEAELQSELLSDPDKIRQNNIVESGVDSIKFGDIQELKFSHRSSISSIGIEWNMAEHNCSRTFAFEIGMILGNYSLWEHIFSHGNV